MVRQIASTAFSFWAYLKQLSGPRSGVRLDIEHPCRRAIPELDPLLGDHLHQVSLTRELRWEIRSLFGRIAEALKTKLYHRGVVAPRPRPDDPLSAQEFLIARRAYTQDMQGVWAFRQWMSTSDVLSFALAWTLGYESCARIRCTQESLSEQSDSSHLSHEISASNSQTSLFTPGAIAGLARNDECARQKL
jgi:hypothetical protein